jgi:hypothetical protein
VVAVLRLPLTGVVIGTVLTAKSGVSAEPLIIVGAVVAHVVTLVLSAPRGARAREAGASAPEAVADSTPAVPAAGT